MQRSVIFRYNNQKHNGAHQGMKLRKGIFCLLLCLALFQPVTAYATAGGHSGGSSGGHSSTQEGVAEAPIGLSALAIAFGSVGALALFFPLSFLLAES